MKLQTMKMIKAKRNGGRRAQIMKKRGMKKNRKKKRRERKDEGERKKYRKLLRITTAI